MALRIKTKPAEPVPETSAEKRARKAEYLSTAATADTEAADLRAGLDELTLWPDQHRARYHDVAAAEDRAKRLRQMAADLDAEIAEAEKREADARTIAASEELRREAAEIAKVVADLYRRAPELAANSKRVLDFLRRTTIHNDRLREVGRTSTWNGTATVPSRRPGFEPVTLPRDADAAVIEQFLGELLIPAVTKGERALFKGSRHRLGNGLGG